MLAARERAWETVVLPAAVDRLRVCKGSGVISHHPIAFVDSLRCPMCSGYAEEAKVAVGINVDAWQGDEHLGRDHITLARSDVQLALTLDGGLSIRGDARLEIE